MGCVRMEKIKIILPNVPRVSISQDKAGGTSDHKKLSNLGFNESGHTGFQEELTSEQLEKINNAATTKELGEVASSSYAYTDGEVVAAKEEILGEVDKARATYIEDGSGAHPLKHNEVAEMGIAKGGAFPDTYTLIIGAPIGDFPDVLFTIWHINPCEEAFDVSPDNTMKMLFFGDDCDETYSFTPRANTHYEISFMRQGSEDDKPRIIARVGAWE